MECSFSTLVSGKRGDELQRNYRSAQRRACNSAIPLIYAPSLGCERFCQPEVEHLHGVVSFSLTSIGSRWSRDARRNVLSSRGGEDHVHNRSRVVVRADSRNLDTRRGSSLV